MDTTGVSTETVEYRPGFARALAIAVLVLAALGLGSSLIADFAASWRYIPLTTLVVIGVWLAYFFPAVIVSPGGVEIRNVTRTIALPWPAIQRIETKYALTFYTAYGSYSAWAAPAPGRAEIGRAGTGKVFREQSAGLPESALVAGSIRPGDLPNSSSGQAAMIVRHRWEELRDFGLLDNPKLERAKPRITWHWRSLLLLLLLAALSAVILLWY